MTRLRTLTIILTTSILFACGGQERTSKAVKQKPISINLDALPELKKIVNEIKNGNCVESSLIGEGGSPSNQYMKYEQLRKMASVEQLTSLTDHENSVVRCYAFQALASKKANNVFTVLLKHLHDTASVETQNGCILIKKYTGDYFIDVVTPSYVDLEGYKLNQRERQTLDSILLYDNSILLAEKSVVLDKQKPTTKKHNRIRQ